ncbi:NifB/NifX family molybdenum-iron cluster-binding protein [Calditrichota bacterium]
MNMLVAADDTKLDSKVSKRFGHSKYFLLVDRNDLSIEVIEGVGHDQPRHGLGRFAQFDIDAVIVGQIGPGAYDDLTSAGYRIYSCLGLSVLEAIERVISAEIPHLSSPTLKRSVHSGGGSGYGDGKNRE